MEWNEVPQSTFVKCFIKAGILNSEGTCNANAVEAADDDVDPFAELDGDFTTVEQVAKETSGTDMVSIKVTKEGCYIWPELSVNWEESFYVGQVQELEQDDNDANDKEVHEVIILPTPKLISYLPLRKHCFFCFFESN